MDLEFLKSLNVKYIETYEKIRNSKLKVITIPLISTKTQPTQCSSTIKKSSRLKDSKSSRPESLKECEPKIRTEIGIKERIYPPDNPTLR